MLKPSQAPYTLNRFFQHLREAVTYFPDSGAIEVNTFAWVDHVDELSHATLGHDIRSHNTDYCYSKRYDKRKSSVFEIAPPLLLVQENQGSITDLFKNNRQAQKIEHRIRMYLLDRWENNKDQNQTKSDRELAEVYNNCRTILRRVCKYIDSVRYATITHLDTSTESGYFNTDLLTYKDTNNLITSFVVKETQLNEFLVNMLSDGQSTELSIVPPQSGHNYAGVSMELKFTEHHCESVEFDFSQAGKSFVYGKS